ncbi:hypothetical protein [Peribacillus sp. Hz7]|uniref:hypothetical protein n=1 Tax=Peribacillus sp. Hz7 TaxID=3344873 RepID=UPI0035CB00D9
MNQLETILSEISIVMKRINVQDIEALSLIIHVPAATKYRKAGEHTTIQPLGSLFDQCTHILFDGICLEYASRKQVSHEQAFQKHSNME